MEILGLVDVSATWILVAGLLLLIYIYGKRRQRLFQEHGIVGPSPTVFIGNLHQLIAQGVKWEPSEFGEVFGIYVGGLPMMSVENPELIREILIKKFQTFTDRLMLDLDDYPISDGMFFKKGDVWRRIRRISSPTFSGSKLRMMSEKIVSCSEKLTDNFLKAASDKSDIVVKDYFGALTMDVIASTAFGMDTDSQNEMDGRLLTEAKKIFADAKGIVGIAAIIALLFPGLTPFLKKMGCSTFPRSSVKYVGEVVSQMIKQRREESSKVKRMDFLQLLIDAEDDGGDDVTDKKANENTVDKKHMTTDEVLGQALLFFVAGYETTASTLHYATYLLATNPEVQERAAEEIDSVLGNNPPSYDNIKELVYLDHVITETLRMFPVVTQLNRVASETVTLCGYTIPKGVSISIPTFRIHRNKKIYPDPHKFQPDRWERKSEIDPMSYLPFGHGPRQCIGMRLAQIEMKFALATVLKKVKFIPAADTPKTLEAKDLEMKATFNTKKPIKWERKSEIDLMSYLPFGHGPRQCIGMRLAQIEMKFALATVLKKVKFIPAADTPKTLEAKDLEMKATFNTKKPIKLRVEAR